jgi:hypothetical protein
VKLDVPAVADLVMVKPAMAEPNLLVWVVNAVDVPVAAYQGAGVGRSDRASRGWIDRDCAFGVADGDLPIRDVGPPDVLGPRGGGLAPLSNTRVDPGRRAATSMPCPGLSLHENQWAGMHGAAVV